ncbi:hypothetical protein AB0067_27140, partial [Klebsiella pneumoniae]
MTARWDPETSLLGGTGLVSNPDATNRKNLFLLRQLRWLAVVGQIVTILLVRFSFDIPLPLAPMGCVVLFLIGLNALSALVLRSSRPVSNVELFIALFL